MWAPPPLLLFLTNFSSGSPIHPSPREAPLFFSHAGLETFFVLFPPASLLHLDAVFESAVFLGLTPPVFPALGVGRTGS